MRPRRGIAATVLVGLAVSALWLGHSGRDAGSQETLVTQGRRLFADKGCLGCHTVGVVGTPIGPDLRATSARYDVATLARWLRDPSAQEATRHMPAQGLSEAEAAALAAYLVSLR
jgi:cytochrome c oxidase subunit 2